ncbi:MULTISPECIES: DUF6879 family protein [Streptomyces]|uniref:DUF6879 family protein n=1 Tax=Streptomyces TaxID=1883 RepID=UPI002D7F68D1|nr:DUF6879 family protein [Streptomyces sp. GMR22]
MHHRLAYPLATTPRGSRSMATAVRQALINARRSAVHLEMRDIYTPGDPDFADWRAGVRFAPSGRWRSWFDLVVSTVQLLRWRWELESGHGYEGSARARHG